MGQISQLTIGYQGSFGGVRVIVFVFVLVPSYI